MLNLSFVRSFVAVAETGSFQKAAEQLSLSQPTLSQHIGKLEDRLGAKLFERGRARSRTTPEGDNVLPLARAMLRMADRLTQAVKRPDLRIGASGNIADYYLPASLAAFEQDTPEPTPWHLLQAENPVLADMLLKAEIDVAVTEWQPQGADITAYPWREEPLVLIVAADHPLASRRSIGLADLEALPMIGGAGGTGTGTLLRDTLGRDASRLETRFSLGSTEAVKSAVISGLGYSIVLKGSVETEMEAGRLAGLLLAGVDLRKTFYVSHRTTEHPDSPAMTFVRHLLGTDANRSFPFAVR